MAKETIQRVLVVLLSPTIFGEKDDLILMKEEEVSAFGSDIAQEVEDKNLVKNAEAIVKKADKLGLTIPDNINIKKFTESVKEAAFLADEDKEEDEDEGEENGGDSKVVDVTNPKLTIDQLKDIAKEKEIAIPENITKKADIVEFLQTEIAKQEAAKNDEK